MTRLRSWIHLFRLRRKVDIMEIRMELLSDTIFGSGESVPGGEDISILTDGLGFPFFKGETFKGIIREEMGRYLEWTGKAEEETQKTIEKYFGKAGSDDDTDKLEFSNFELPGPIRQAVMEQVETDFSEAEQVRADIVTGCLSSIRTFTAIENGSVKKGSLRSARCVSQGLCFYSTVSNLPQEKTEREMIKEVISMVKYVGSMRNRGFGRVRISVKE